MKKYKSLGIFYLIPIVLSLISLVTHNKGNDFLTAVSSITSELSLIISIILIIYALLFCSSYVKDNRMKRESIIISVIILIITSIVVFLSFINVYAHRNVIDYLIRVINKKESIDIVKLFFKFLIVYLYIFLFSFIGILLYNFYNKDKKIEFFLLLVLLFILVVILLNIKYRVIATIEAILYILFLSMEKGKLK